MQIFYFFSLLEMLVNNDVQNNFLDRGEIIEADTHGQMCG